MGPMNTANLKNLIVLLSDAACKWGVTGEDEAWENFELLAALMESAGSVEDKLEVEVETLDMVSLQDPTPERVLSACMRYEDEVWEYMCELPDPLNDKAWRIMDGVRTAAIERLPGYEHWPLD